MWVCVVFFHCTHRFFIPTSAIPVNRGWALARYSPLLLPTDLSSPSTWTYEWPLRSRPWPLDTLKLHLLLPGARESETSRSNIPLVPTSSALMLTGTWWETPKQKYSYVPWALSDALRTPLVHLSQKGQGIVGLGPRNALFLLLTPRIIGLKVWPTSGIRWESWENWSSQLSWEIALWIEHIHPFISFWLGGLRL